MGRGARRPLLIYLRTEGEPQRGESNWEIGVLLLRYATLVQYSSGDFITRSPSWPWRGSALLQCRTKKKQKIFGHPM